VRAGKSLRELANHVGDDITQAGKDGFTPVVLGEIERGLRPADQEQIRLICECLDINDAPLIEAAQQWHDAMWGREQRADSRLVPVGTAEAGVPVYYDADAMLEALKIADGALQSAETIFEGALKSSEAIPDVLSMVTAARRVIARAMKPKGSDGTVSLTKPKYTKVEVEVTLWKEGDRCFMTDSENRGDLGTVKAISHETSPMGTYLALDVELDNGDRTGPMPATCFAKPKSEG